MWDCVGHAVYSVLLVGISDRVRGLIWSPLKGTGNLSSTGPLYAATETLILPSCSHGTVKWSKGLPRCKSDAMTAQHRAFLLSDEKKNPPHSRIEGMTEMWLGTYRCFFFCHYFCWNDSLLLCSWRNITHYRGQLWFCFIFKYILHHPPTHSAAFLKERHTPTWEDRTPTISRASCSSTRGLTALWIVMAASPELRNWCRVHFLEKLVGSRWRLAVWYWFLLHAKVKEIQCQWCYCKFYESGDLEKPITTYWLYFFNICARQSLWVTTGEGLLHIWAHHSLSMLMWRQSKLSSSHSATL